MVGRTTGLIAVLSALTIGLSACATTPLYAPQAREGSSGYSEQKLDENHYRVSFTGRRTTSRERVEDALILRAAEVTLAAGYTHFVIDQRQTDQEVTRPFGPVMYGPSFYGPYYAWGRYGRYGYGYDPFWGGIGYYWDDYEHTRYVAFANIALLTAVEARGHANAIEAAEVVRNLRHKVAPPLAT